MLTKQKNIVDYLDSEMGGFVKQEGHVGRRCQQLLIKKIGQRRRSRMFHSLCICWIDQDPKSFFTFSHFVRVSNHFQKPHLFSSLFPSKKTSPNTERVNSEKKDEEMRETNFSRAFNFTDYDRLRRKWKFRDRKIRIRFGGGDRGNLRVTIDWRWQQQTRDIRKICFGSKFIRQLPCIHKNVRIP